MTDIVYRLATHEDYDLLLEFLRVHCYPEEPLTLACKPEGQDKYDEEATMSNISKEDGVCVIGVCGDRIVGALLAGCKRPDEEKLLLEEASKIPGTKWGKILQFLAYVERKSNVCEVYGVNRAIHCHIMGVDRDFRGKDISAKLVEKAIERSKELGYPLFTNDCTNALAAKFCERIGMECVSVTAFKDYRLPGSDEQVFFPPEGHSLVKSFAKRLV